jgi:predicted membrane-bound spermidine synthase
MTSATTLLLTSVFFLTGAAALVFEFAWFHLLGLLFGNSVWATSIVLSSFMGGLALGNYLSIRFAERVKRPILVYSIAEVLVGCVGFALTMVLPMLPGILGHWFTSAAQSAAVMQSGRVVGAFLLLLIPATAMGATLPFLVTAVTRESADYASVLGRLYAVNAFGAVFGVLLHETILVRAFGVRGAAACAALANLVAAGVALTLLRFARNDPRASPVRENREPRPQSWPVLTGAFLAGANLLALEVVWFRFLLMFVSNTSFAQAVMLATVLLGISLGSWITGLWVRNRPVSGFALVLVASIAASLVLGTYVAFRYAGAESPAFEWRPVAAFSLRLMLPVACASGALFVLQGSLLRHLLAHSTRTTGVLTLVNTAGAMTGAVFAGFIALRHFGMERSIFMAALSYALIAVLAAHFHRGWRTSEKWAGCGAAAGFVLCAVLFPHGLMSREFFARVARRFEADGSKLIAVRETPTETLLYLRQDWLEQPVYYRLVTNGYSMSGTGLTAQRYMRLFAYLPAALRAEPMKKALLISYGVGVTASALRDLRALQHIDVVDISSEIVAMSSLIYPENDHPLRDPRFQVHIEDGRFFLLSTSERYDLITGEPPPPRAPGTVNLYTKEHFQLMHDRLSPGGLATYWLPINDLLESDTRAIIRAFTDVFEDSALWMGTPFDWILVGRRAGGSPATTSSVRALWADATIGPTLAITGFETPGLLGAAFLGDGSDWRQVVAADAPLTDDRCKRLTTLLEPPSDDRFAWFTLVTNPKRTRAQFESSRFVARSWPSELRQETLSGFEIQGIINASLRTPPSPLRDIAALDHLLENTDLVTLPLWLMGSDAVHARIADQQNPQDGLVAYVRGVSLLAHRNYPAAAAMFAHARTSGWSTSACAGLEIYALCKSGEWDAARVRAEPARASMPDNADASTFWIWMSRTCGIGPR